MKSGEKGRGGDNEIEAHEHCRRRTLLEDAEALIAKAEASNVLNP